MNQPKISVITVVRNDVSHIEQTMFSVTIIINTSIFINISKVES